MSVRTWPLAGHVQQFYSGGFGDSDEDCRRLLRQMARWSEHSQPPGTVIDGVVISQVTDGDALHGEPTTWQGSLWLTDAAEVHAFVKVAAA